MVIEMAIITCEKKKFQSMLEYMTIGGLLPTVGLDVFKDGSIRCVQFDKNSSCGAKVVAVGVFDGFTIDGVEEKDSIAMNAEKVLGYLKTLKGDENLHIEINDTHIFFRSGSKKITTDRLDIDSIDTYMKATPFKMADNYLPTYKKGTINPTTCCSVESTILREMVGDTKAVDQKHYKMSFASPNVFKYEASGGNSKRGNDSIENTVTDVSIEGENVEATISAAVPEIANLMNGAIEMHIAHDGKDVFPVWFKMVGEWMKIGYMIPTIDISDEE